MKRILFFIFTLLFICVFFCGCASEPTASLSDIMQDINDQLNLTDMKALDDVAMLNQYYLIEEDTVKSFAAQVSNDESDFTEFVMIEAVDESSAEEIATLLYNYYCTRQDMADSYDADLANQLRECSVEQKGVYVSLFICESVDDVKAIYNSYFLF